MTLTLLELLGAGLVIVVIQTLARVARKQATVPSVAPAAGQSPQAAQPTRAAPPFPPPPARRAGGPVRGAPEPLATSPRSRPAFADALASPGQIRTAVILAEVLAPPVSMR